MERRDFKEEFWMVNSIDDVRIGYEGDIYVFACDLEQEDDWYSFHTKRYDGYIFETFMFRFKLKKVIEIE